ncbi:hypothetical protein C8Q75DRAFT_811742 [Abortiporus biennis]|nr:hypothetical protein C8Q75DRAFT_811742 [Abortiporus biennis]
MTSLKRSSSPSDSADDQGPSSRRKIGYDVTLGLLGLEAYQRLKSSDVVRAIVVSIDIIADLHLTRSSVENYLELFESTFESGNLDSVFELINRLSSPKISTSLSAPSHTKMIRIRVSPDPPPAVQVEAIKKAWLGKYTTNHHEIFSGTGKSRLVHELARIVFTFPFNLRYDDDYSSFSYPKPDSQVRDFLTTQSESNSDEHIACNYLKFFICLFTNARQHLLDDRFRSQKSLRDFAFAWREYLDDGTRTDLYKKS